MDKLNSEQESTHNIDMYRQSPVKHQPENIKNNNGTRTVYVETWGFPVVKLGSTRLPVMVYKGV